jgi:hypothetical protein
MVLICIEFLLLDDGAGQTVAEFDGHFQVLKFAVDSPDPIVVKVENPNLAVDCWTGLITGALKVPEYGSIIVVKDAAI